MPETPASRRIVDEIRRQIESGQLKSGDKLPKIRELAEQYECSETPVKIALSALDAMGLLVRRQGKGVYVR